MNSADVSSSVSPPRLAVIGGGISGMAAAQRLVEHHPDAQITLFEATDRLGGLLRTTEKDGFFFEHSADNFIVNDELPFAGALCEKVGVELIETAEEYRGALILRNRQFHPVPDGLQLMSVRRLASIWMTPLLSLRGKLRASYEPFVPRKQSNYEESLREFSVRRFGEEMFEQIIQPLVSGIYTADPSKLSVAAALPQYVKQEQKFGSLRKAALADRSTAMDSGARYSMFRAPRHGMQSLVSRLEESLGDRIEMRKLSPIRRLIRRDQGWSVEPSSGETEHFTAVVAATSPRALTGILPEEAKDLARQLDAIEHVSTAIVCLGFRRNQVAHPLNAFGCVIPAVENRKVLAISFTNVKFPTRAPDGCVLMRVFAGGALQPELAELEDDVLMSTVLEELTELLGVSGKPLTSMILRWPNTTPQFHVGHLDRLDAIERSLAGLPGLAIAGNAYRGVGVPQCIRSGWQAADRISEVLHTRTGG